MGWDCGRLGLKWKCPAALRISCQAAMGTCLPGAKLGSGVAGGGCSHAVMLMVWKASGIGFPAPICPVSLLQVDSWALGVLLYTLVYGTMPFDGFDHKNLIRQISSGEYREPTQPSGACSRGSGVEWELPERTLSASVLASGRSLLLFLLIPSSSLLSGRAGLWGRFPE